jgi:hypothetical protein
MKNSVAKGEHYDRLLDEFIAKGGDLSLCPFETADYKWREPPYEKIGTDCDYDPVIDQFWKDVQEGKAELTGTTPTEEEWAEWEREYEEIVKRKKSR